MRETTHSSRSVVGAEGELLDVRLRIVWPTDYRVYDLVDDNRMQKLLAGTIDAKSQKHRAASLLT